MAPAAPAVYLHTYGCQMNVLDSTLVKEQLLAEGYRFVDAPDAPPDAPQDAPEVVLLNTCSVRALSEQKVWSFLGRLGQDPKRRAKLTIGVLGCMAEREGPNILAKMPHVGLLCGPSNLSELPQLLAAARRDKKAQVSLSGHTSRRSSTREAAIDSLSALDYARAMAEVPGVVEDGEVAAPRQAYVRITRGCNKFCAFCVVPFTRGPEVHRPPEHVLLEVRRLVERGVREVTLLGQTINHYAYRDGGKTTSFADLLALLHDGVPELARLRFLTSYPRDFTDDALDVMACSPRISPYLHLPAQTGSDRLLKKMNRGYDLACYLDLVARARQKLPRLRLSGDMIVGYPTETDADHEASVRLLREVRYKSCYVFKYSPRSCSGPRAGPRRQHGAGAGGEGRPAAGRCHRRRLVAAAAAPRRPPAARRSSPGGPHRRRRARLLLRPRRPRRRARRHHGGLRHRPDPVRHQDLGVRRPGLGRGPVTPRGQTLRTNPGASAPRNTPRHARRPRLVRGV